MFSSQDVRLQSYSPRMIFLLKMIELKLNNKGSTGVNRNTFYDGFSKGIPWDLISVSN